jgi:NAD(P)-dependent dehydrogenase (short-subunit alcohol dehydrogenase family)
MARSQITRKQKAGIPPQAQDRQPGLETLMRPRPASSAHGYGPAGKLEGKIAVVSGGDSGIGRAVSVAFAKEGADVAVLYFDEHEDAKRTDELVRAAGRRCLLLSGDIGDRSVCVEMIARVIDEFGHLHILVNNAGEQHTAEEFSEITEPQLERTFRTNVFAAFFLTQAALEHMGESACIINCCSVTAYRGSKHLVDYAATKGALVAFTRSLAQQLAPRGVRVNGVAPGPIWTPLIRASFSPEEVAEFGKDVPLGRPGQPDEVAPSFVFLAGADSTYMTGQMLHPNGGEIING